MRNVRIMRPVGILRSIADRARSALAPLPTRTGDVAQVSDLSIEVQQAFGIAGAGGTPITRRDAMRVPAFARGRNVICGTSGLLELRAVRGDTVEDRALLTQPDQHTTRQHVLTWTVDDLLCHGIAWWKVTDRDANGWPVHARRVAPGLVTIDGDRVYCEGAETNLRDLIRFDGPHEGVLSFGADVLRTALALELAVKRFADNPEPTALLYDKRPIEADVPELDPTKVDDMLTSWAARNRSSTVRWLNRMTGYERLTYTPSELDLTAARQQAAVQVARLLGMPSRQVNAPSETGMTYQNVAADRTEVLETTCAVYLAAIEQRLTFDDVTPRGWRVRFDRDAATAGTTRERIDNAAAFVDGRLGTPDEARAKYLGMGPLDAPGGDQLAGTPAPAPPAPDPGDTP